MSLTQQVHRSCNTHRYTPTVWFAGALDFFVLPTAVSDYDSKVTIQYILNNHSSSIKQKRLLKETFSVTVCELSGLNFSGLLV